MRRQANRAAAGRRRRPDVAPISESDAVTMNIGKAQQLCLRESCGGHNQKHGDDRCRSESAEQGVAFQQGESSSRMQNQLLELVSKESCDSTTRTIFTC